MILSGLTPHRLTFAGRILLTALAAALLPLAPSLAQSAKDNDSDKPKTATVTVTASNISDNDDDDDKDDDDEDDDDEDDKKDKKKQIEVRVRSAMKARAQALKAHSEAKEVHGRMAEVHRQGFNLLVSPTNAGPKKEATKDEKEALEKARAEMKELGEAMGKAAKRLAELEMKVNGKASMSFGGMAAGMVGRFPMKFEGQDGNIVIFKDGPDNAVFTTAPHGAVNIRKPGETFEVRTETLPKGKGEVRVFSRVITEDIKGSEGRNAQIRIIAPKPTVPPIAPSPGDKDQNKRIEALEKQLQTLLKEIKEMKRDDKR